MGFAGCKGRGTNLATTDRCGRSRLSIWAVARRWRLPAVLTAAAWIVLAPVAPRSEELPADLEEALQKGVAAMGQKQWFLADQQFKIVAGKAYGYPEVALQLAQFNEARGGRDLIAALWYRCYVAARPDDPRRDQFVAKIGALERNALTVARGLINNALAATGNIAGTDRSGPLTQIAIAQAKLGDMPGALVTASNAAGANQYSDPYGELANALANKGNLAAADEALRRVDQSHRSNALRAVAYTLTAAKRPSDALAYAAPTTGADRAHSYGYIAVAYAQAGDKRAARANLDTAVLAANSLDQFQRPYTLIDLVETASNVAEFDIAKRLYADAVKAIPPANLANFNYILLSAKWRIVNGLVPAGRLAEAESLVSTLLPESKASNIAYYRDFTQENIEKARQQQAIASIKLGKLAEFEGQLAHDPGREPMSLHEGNWRLPTNRRRILPDSAATSKPLRRALQGRPCWRGRTRLPSRSIASTSPTRS